MFCFFAPFLRSVESSSNVENGIRRHSLASSLSLTISSCHLFCSLSLFIVVLSVSLSLFIVISRCLQFLFIFFVQVGSKCVLFTFTLFGVSSSASSVFLSFVFHNDTFLLFAYYETSSSLSVCLSFFLSLFGCNISFSFHFALPTRLRDIFNDTFSFNFVVFLWKRNL